MMSKCSLRNITTETADLIREWRNQEHIRKLMFNQEVVTKEDHANWLASLEKSTNRDVKIFYYDDIPYGVVTFSKMQVNQNIFEWGFYIGEQNAPRGMGTYLGITALDYYFMYLSDHKLCAEVLAYNKKSINFHLKMGFEIEGILRSQYLFENKYSDIHLYGLMKNEWLIQRKKLIKKLGEY